MATYRVNSGAAGANNGTSWTDAFTTFAGAVAAASSSGDRILVHYTHTENLGSDTTYTFLNNLSVICVDKDSSDAPTVMGAAAWIGSSSASRQMTLAGAYTVFIYGLTLRSAGSTFGSLQIANTDGGHFELESPYLWLGTTHATSRIICGSGTAAQTSYVRLKNPTMRFGAVTQGITPRCGELVIEGGSVSASGSIPTTLFIQAQMCAGVSLTGTDLSALGSNSIVFGTSDGAATYRLHQCKLGSGLTTPLATQSPANKSAYKMLLTDCANGDTHGIFEYHDAFGSLTTDSGIYVTAGPAAASWKIVTSSACSYVTPFVSPWVALHHSDTSAITPRLEILRDGSATAYTAAQVWGEFVAKVTTGSVVGTFHNDAQSLADYIAGTTATDQATGVGTGSWTGEGGTAWSGKVDSGASLTPAETGEILGRVCVGAASTTVYVDPVVRIA